MSAAIVMVIPDDLAGNVDAGSNGGKADRQGLVEGRVIIGRHDLGSLCDRLSCREASIGKLSRYQTLARPELHPEAGCDAARTTGIAVFPWTRPPVAMTSTPTVIAPRRAPIRHV